MFALGVIFVVFLFGNGFCQAAELEACGKRVTQLEALIDELKGSCGKFSLLSSL